MKDFAVCKNFCLIVDTPTCRANALQKVIIDADKELSYTSFINKELLTNCPLPFINHSIMTKLQYQDFLPKDSWLIFRLDTQVADKAADIYMLMELLC